MANVANVNNPNANVDIQSNEIRIACSESQPTAVDLLQRVVSSISEGTVSLRFSVSDISKTPIAALSKKLFYEEYLDTADLLAKHDYRLRRRWNFDGSIQEYWGLKWPKTTDSVSKHEDFSCATYLVSRDPRMIMAQINQLLEITGLPKVGSFGDFNSVVFPVVRYEYSNDDVSIHFDDTKLGDSDFYCMGSVQIRPGAILTEEVLAYIDGAVAVYPSRDKFGEFLNTKQGGDQPTEVPVASRRRKTPVLSGTEDFCPPQQSFAEAYGQWLQNSEMENEVFADESEDCVSSLLEDDITEYHVWRDGQVVSVPVSK